MRLIINLLLFTPSITSAGAAVGEGEGGLPPFSARRQQPCPHLSSRQPACFGESASPLSSDRLAGLLSGGGGVVPLGSTAGSSCPRRGHGSRARAEPLCFLFLFFKM